MSKNKKYKFNHETLAYEIHRIPARVRLSKGFLFFLISVAISLGYYFIYTEYFNLETPKLLSLKRDNEELASRLELINRRFEGVTKSLHSLQMRDNYVYRPVFGMEEIPQDIRNAGFGGTDRYSYLENFEKSGILSKTAFNLDVLYKKAYVQTRSFDDLLQLAHNADAMSLCVPAIPPVNIASSRIRLSSNFGYRKDPFHGDYRMHSGVDISGPIGEIIYATGNGKVIQVGHDFFGYGNFVMIDHGFGYKTRYAHLKNATVTLGRIVKRGEQIGLMGNTGRSQGPHVHYEVIYKNSPVNPLNYYNRDVDEKGFLALINSAG